MSDYTAARDTALGLRGTITFAGEKFTLAEKVGVMPLLEFANAAQSGLDSADVEGYAAMYAMLEDCFDADEFARFRRLARKSKAGAEEILQVVQDAIGVISGRPTVSPSESSDGRSSVSPSSSDAFTERKRALGLVPIDPGQVGQLTG